MAGVAISGGAAGRLIWAAAALFLALATAQASWGYTFASHPGFTHGNDDAFISYLHARNLVEAGVLSFNPSDQPPVEGFSNPLHVAIGALLILAVGEGGIHTAWAVIGALCTAAAIVLSARFAARRLGPAAGAFVGLALALSPPLWVHAGSGLETAPVLLLQVILWQGAVRLAEAAPGGPAARGALATCLLAVALLTAFRTDGFIWAVFAGVWLAMQGRWRPALALAGAAAAVFLAIMAARLAYYGLPMPLPFYVKVSGPHLERFLTAGRLLGGMTLKSGFLLPLLGLALAGLLWLRALVAGGRPRWTPPSAELALASALLAYYVYVGGDIYRDRFLLLLLPLGYVALARGLALGRAPRRLAGAALVFALSLGAAAAQDQRLRWRAENRHHDMFVELGRFLREAHPGALLATGAAGKIPYFSRLETVDMLGLNDRHIAMTPPDGANPGHNKYDPDYVFARRPDVICTFLLPGGDLAFGITRARYEPLGYELAHLALRTPRDGVAVAAIRGMAVDRVFAEYGAEAGLACLVRNPSSL